MTSKIAIRIRDNGEIYVMDRGASGYFEFGDPSVTDKHKQKNIVLKKTLDEALQAIRDGFHPRMKGLETGQWNMIAPASIQIVEVPK